MSNRSPTPTSPGRKGLPKKDADLFNIVSPERVDKETRLLSAWNFDTTAFSVPHHEENSLYHPRVETNLVPHVLVDNLDPITRYLDETFGVPANRSFRRIEQNFGVSTIINHDLAHGGVNSIVHDIADNFDDYAYANIDTMNWTNNHIGEGIPVSSTPKKVRRVYKGARVSSNPSKARRGSKKQGPNKVSAQGPAPEEGTKVALNYIDGDPKAKDIKCGRGEAVKRHNGNKRFHEEKIPFQKRYWKTNKHKDKKAIAESFVIFLKNECGCRFVNYCKTKKKWYIIADERALEKVKQVLRTKPKIEESPTHAVATVTMLNDDASLEELYGFAGLLDF